MYPDHSDSSTKGNKMFFETPEQARQRNENHKKAATERLAKNAKWKKEHKASR